MRWLRRARAWIGRRPWIAVLVLVTAGNFAGWRSLEAEAENRCQALIRAVELLGEELEAPQERVDRFIARLHDETDC